MEKMLASLLDNLYPKDLLLVCESNPDYVSVCDNERFWKERVKDDYDIDYTITTFKQLYHDLTFENAKPLTIKIDGKIVGRGFQYPEHPINESISNFFRLYLKKSITDYSGLELLIDKYNGVLAIYELPLTGESTKNSIYSNDKIHIVDIITDPSSIQTLLNRLSIQ